MNEQKPMTRMFNYLLEKVGVKVEVSDEEIETWMRNYSMKRDVHRPFVGMAHINRVVTNVFKMGELDLMIKPGSNSPRYVIPRYIAMVLMNKYGNSMTDAAKFYGYKTHSMASRARVVIRDESMTNPTIKWAVEVIDGIIAMGEDFEGKENDL